MGPNLHFGALCEPHRREIESALQKLDERVPNGDRLLLSESQRIWEESARCADCRRMGETVEPEGTRAATARSPLVESRPSLSQAFWSAATFHRFLEQEGLLPADRLPRRLRRILAAIKCANPDYRPAAVRLSDGMVLPAVYFVRSKTIVERQIKFWHHFVRARYVVDVQLSARQIPLRIAEELNAVGETGMGSLEFIVTLKGGVRIPCWYAGFEEFIELPSPHRPDEIASVEIGRGLALQGGPYLTHPEYVWCPIP